MLFVTKKVFRAMFMFIYEKICYTCKRKLRI